MSKISRTLCLCLGLVLPAAANAEEPIAPEALRAKVLVAQPERNDGWQVKLNIGSTFSFNQSASVVGSPDGLTLQMGGLLDGTGEYISGRHTWTNSLKVNYTQSKTPVLDTFVKASDLTDISTTYLYRLANPEWIGPYVRARLSTQLSPGYIVKPGAYTLSRSMLNGSTQTDAHGPQEVVQLTGGFDPLLFNEAVGLFANPTESEAVTVKLKLGAGTQQVVSSWGYAVTDNAATPEIELKQLQSAVQIGAELEALAFGQISADLKWKAKALFFHPVYTSKDGTASGIDALNADFSAGVSYKLAKWLSLDYVFSAKRVPLVSDKWQVQNGAVLTFGISL